MDYWKPARSSGSASSDAPRKPQRHGEEEAPYADVPDLMAQLHLKLSTQLEARVRDLETSTYCTLPTKRERHQERDARRRKDLQRHGGKPTKRWKEEVHKFGSSTLC